VDTAHEATVEAREVAMAAVVAVEMEERRKAVEGKAGAKAVEAMEEARVVERWRRRQRRGKYRRGRG
jgi:hypothetical protein